MTISLKQTLVTKPSMFLENESITRICREYASTRDANTSKPIGKVDENTVIGPSLDVQATLQYGRHCIEVKINSLQIENIVSWEVISHGLDRYVTPLPEGNSNSTSTSSLSRRFLDIRAPGNRWRRTRWVFLDVKHSKRQTKQSNVSVKMPPPYFAGRVNYVAAESDPQPSLEARVLLCGNKIYRNHILWKTFRASPVWRASQQKKDNDILFLQWIMYQMNQRRSPRGWLRNWGTLQCCENQTEQFIGK